MLEKWLTPKRIVITFLCLLTVLILLVIYNYETEYQNIADPVLEKGFIFSPTFETSQGTLQAGKAFAVTVGEDSTPIMVTVLHIFGPDGGLTKQIKSVDLRHDVLSAQFEDLLDPTRVVEGDENITIKEASPMPAVTKDIAAFKIKKSKSIKPAKVYDGSMQVGEYVWLASTVYEGASPEQTLHRAVVVESGDRGLIFEYDNPKINLQATSGAPILNEKGEVVGINLGGMRSEDTLYGVANPSSSFLKMLLQH